MFYVATYDCPSDKRRRKIMELCKDYLFHIQGSVFEGNLTTYRFNKFLNQIKKLIDFELDSLRIYVISPNALDSTVVMGRPALNKDKPIITISDQNISYDEILPFD